MGFILQAFQRFAEWLTSLVLSLWTAMMTWWAQLWNYVNGLFSGWLPEDLQDAMSTEQFSAALDAIDLLGFFVPLGPMLAIVAVATGIVGTVRVLRWVGGVNVLGFSVGS